MIAVASRMISIMIVACCFSWSQTRQRAGISMEAAFHAFWRGDDLFDLSGINMEPEGIKDRDGQAAINIKIL